MLYWRGKINQITMASIARYERFDKDGIELVIDTLTGESFATLRGYARMSGKAVSTISERLKGVREDQLKTAEILTPGGLQGVRLLDEDIITEWIFEDNPKLAKAMLKAGVRVYLHTAAGFKVTSDDLPHYSDNWLCPSWNKARTSGKGKRLTLTGETKAWIERREAEGVKFTPAQKRKIYAGHSDALNLGVYDRTAQDLRDTLGIKKSANLRDYFNEDEIGALQTVEEAAAWLIHSKDMHPIEAIKRVIELIEYRRRFVERHRCAIAPKKTKRLKETERQLSLF